MRTPEIIIDAEIQLQDITVPFYKILCQMEPYGPENMRPVFVARHVYDTGYSRLIKDAHIKFCLRQNQTFLDGIGFNMAEKYNLLRPGQPVDIVFNIDENEWNGEKKLQLKVIDVKASQHLPLSSN